MRYSYRIALALAAAGIIACAGIYAVGHPPAILAGHGDVAAKERALFIEASLLMLIVAVPVWGLLFFFAWRYRAGNKAAYTPEWEHSKLDELIWWAIPLEIILVLAALTWTSTHALDPRKPLDSAVPPLRVEVVALPWKWLFIYPDQGIATLNYLEIPVGVPVSFQITADAPMNSFWIPELGSQIYAMTGMATEVQLRASKEGDYAGLSANYSGEGFAGMRFIARARSQEAFDAWVTQAKAATSTLSRQEYAALAKPGDAGPERSFSSVEPGLFRAILDAYAAGEPAHSH